MFFEKKHERNFNGRNSKFIWRNVGVYSAEREVNQQMLDNKSEEKWPLAAKNVLITRHGSQGSFHFFPRPVGRFFAARIDNFTENVVS